MTVSTRARTLDDATPVELRVRLFREPGRPDAVVLWFAPGSDEDGGAPLTAAEREVRALILAGLSNRAIASVRRVAVATVASQVRAVFEKYGVSSRAELVCLTRPLHRGSW